MKTNLCLIFAALFILTPAAHAQFEVVIPNAIDGLPVTSIGGSAFSDDIGLTSVTIAP